ncbi:hypothetical protein Tco_0451810 [Tanacetum coccineum]
MLPFRCVVLILGVLQQWFDLSADLLRKALAITPVNPAHPFELPPSGDTVIDFVNELGYPEPVEIVSSIRTDYVYQSLDRQFSACSTSSLTRKTSGSDKSDPSSCNAVGNRHSKTNVAPARANMGKSLLKGSRHFFSHKAQPQAVEEPKEESNSFSSLMAVFQSDNSITWTSINHSHRRPDLCSSPLDMLSFGKSQVCPKVRKGKPFPIVDEDDEAQQESTPHEEGNDPELELAKKLSLETPQEKGEGEGDDADLERAIKLSLDPAFLPQGQAPVGGVTIRDPVSETTPKLHEVVGKGRREGDDADANEPSSVIKLLLIRQLGPLLNRWMKSDKEIHESSSTSDSERTESDTEAAAPKGDKDQDEVDTSTVTSGVSIPVSAPEKAHEALAGPDPEPMKEDKDWAQTLENYMYERVIDNKPESHSGSMSSMKNLDDTFNFGDQFLHDNPTEDDQEKSKVREESDSTIPDSSHQTVTSTPPVIAPFTEVSSSKPSLLVTPPPINTEATTITTSLPEITPFIALQLRVARLEQEMSEVKKTDHSADVLASIRSQVPTAVNNYLGTKLDDALLKSRRKLSKHRREQDEEKQDSTYSIRSTDKVDLEEFDLKSAPPALLSHEYEERLKTMDKELQSRSTKEKQIGFCRFGVSNPPERDGTKVQRKPSESGASANKTTSALSSIRMAGSLTQEMLVVDYSMTDRSRNLDIENNLTEDIQ